MLDKKLKRKRRATKTRAKIRQLGVPRLCVGRTSKHIYAQIIVSSDRGDKVLASASTLDKEIKESVQKSVSNTDSVLETTGLPETKAQINEHSQIKTLGIAAGNNIKSATVVGDFIAKRALAAGINQVAFDRSGFKYHGCIKALAEAAREAGLPF